MARAKQRGHQRENREGHGTDRSWRRHLLRGTARTPGEAQGGLAGRPEAPMSAFIVAPEAEEDIFHVWLHLLREAGMQTASRIEGESGGTAAPRRRTTGNRRGVAWQTQRKALLKQRLT